MTPSIRLVLAIFCIFVLVPLVLACEYVGLVMAGVGGGR
jgi:hypothetical protein